MKPFILPSIILSLIFCMSCKKIHESRSSKFSFVVESIKGLPEGSKVRVSEFLIATELLSIWTPEKENNLLLDSEGSFGHYSRTFSSVAADQEKVLVTVLGKGAPEEVAGGDYLVDEIRVGDGGDSESIFLWNGDRYIYKEKRTW